MLLLTGGNIVHAGVKADNMLTLMLIRLACSDSIFRYLSI